MTRHILARSVAIGLLLTTSAACGYVEGRTTRFQPPLARPTPSDEVGHDLYLRDCAWCHGRTAEGTANGPDLVSGTNGPAATHFMLTTGRMPLDFPEEAMRHRDAMYGSAEIDAIVDYVSTLQPGTGPEIPTPEPALGDLGDGAELYQENCAACHSTTAVGGALTPGPDATDVRANDLVAPALFAANPTEITEAMVVGPGTMPVFGVDTFTEEERNSIVRYVLYLQRPEDRGGADIGRIGPVAEGAVGWLVGLGLLLVVTLWIGTRTRPKSGGNR